ncbi:MAG: hypothetical protein KDM91_22010, partial [Verrucomicrobiae bacterium]|nr:hypothetical protein [Verrucomicrobiae bacterium]
MKNPSLFPKHDCSDRAGGDPTRRRFLAGAAGALAIGASPAAAFAADKSPRGETLVKSLYDSLSAEQRGKIVIPWEDALRSRVENNWHILPQRIGTFLNRDQQAMAREIFLSLHSDEYRDQVWNAFIHDNRGKGVTTPEEIFGTGSVALFGTPGADKFEMVFTGRHCTRRCDGNSVAGAAFGGPIFYGHAAESFNEKAGHPGNAYWFQAKQANAVFAMLDGKQREIALRPAGREEKGNQTVELKGKAEGL